MFPNPHNRVFFPDEGETAEFPSRGENGSGVVSPPLGGLIPSARAQFRPGWRQFAQLIELA
jgi:hypothetical protein